MNTILVIKATYIEEYKVKIEFSDDTFKIVDFEPFLRENHHPQWDKYNTIHNFKKFKIENGNLVWGRNWDLMFPTYSLHEGNILERC